MEETQEQNLNAQETVTEAQITPAEPMAPINITVTNVASASYASFFGRLLAALVDGIVLSLVGGVLGGIAYAIAGEDASSVVGPLMQLLFPIYAVVMISKYGATLGKMALGIRVQNQVTGENLTIVEAFLREVVGKFVSGIALGLGYLWVLWDPNKQAWHDKIGKSIVVRTK